MKFIAPVSCFISHSSPLSGGGLLLWPDSCALPSGRPLFIPDFADKFLAVPAFAVKIDRLGKCIAPKFASRYFSSFSPAVLLFPSEALELLRNSGLPSPDNYCFDSSIVTGKWVATDKTTDFSASISIIGPDFSSQNNFSLSLNVIYEAISLASLRSTLKIGDIILIPMPELATAVDENFSIFVYGSSESEAPLLTTKFK